LAFQFGCLPGSLYPSIVPFFEHDCLAIRVSALFGDHPSSCVPPLASNWAVLADFLIVDAELNMQKLCFVLTLALGGALLLPSDGAEARTHSHYG
jgi:hypothetical protein